MDVQLDAQIRALCVCRCAQRPNQRARNWRLDQAPDDSLARIPLHQHVGECKAPVQTSSHSRRNTRGGHEGGQPHQFNDDTHASVALSTRSNALRTPCARRGGAWHTQRRFDLYRIQYAPL
eukprot:2911528-Prymnesium_polylepis.2